jgi:hypothetical protein
MGDNFEKTVREIMDMMGHGRDEVSNIEIIFRPKLGGQIGRIFAYWVIVYFVEYP